MIPSLVIPEPAEKIPVIAHTRRGSQEPIRVIAKLLLSVKSAVQKASLQSSLHQNSATASITPYFREAFQFPIFHPTKSLRQKDGKVLNSGSIEAAR